MTRTALILLIMAPATAGAFELALPLDCTLGDSCFVQNHVDRDPGPAAQDFTCGPLVYDGHNGTDFALPSLAAMHAGVTVFAAAPGVVKGTRDGVPDISIRDPAAPALDGRDCGNGVVIDHGSGWETQYCHMKQSSISVSPGDSVATGTPLGQVGLSGNTEFAHLHLSVRHDGLVVDPFDPGKTLRCNTTHPPLWSADLPYLPGGLISIGITTAVPDYEDIQAGLPQPQLIPANAPALVVWAYAFGAHNGDTLALAITGPKGEIIQEDILLEKTQARLFRAIGKRLRSAAGWPPGSYSGSATLLRGGKSLGAKDLTIQIGN